MGATITSLNLGGALTAAGPAARAFDAMWDSLWTQTAVPAGALELCRLRLARLHRADAELEERGVVEIDAGKRASVLGGNYAAEGLVTPAEVAALEFAEVYAQDPAALTDELADAVKEHFGDAGLVALVEALGFIDGRIRMARLFRQLDAGAA